jgi:hypothetical protein
MPRKKLSILCVGRHVGISKIELPTRNIRFYLESKNILVDARCVFHSESHHDGISFNL